MGWALFRKVIAVSVAASVPRLAYAIDLPPVSATGAVTYSLQESRPPGSDERSWRNTMTATVNPNTYILAPWLATLSGSLNFSASTSTEEAGSPLDLTGSITLNALPQSSFPTELTYSRFNRSIQTGDFYNDLTGDQLRLISRLHLPWEMTAQTRLTLDRTVASDLYQEDVTDLSIELDKQFGHDNVRLGFGYRDATFDSPEFGTETQSSTLLSLRTHTVLFEDITSDSVATLRMGSFGDATMTEEGIMMQGVTTSTWRPPAVPGLNLTGVLRTLMQDTTLSSEGDVFETQVDTAFGVLGASYQFAPRLIGNAGLSGGYTNSHSESTLDALVQDSSSISSGGNVGLDYSSETHSLLGFDWSWNLGGDVQVIVATEGLEHQEGTRFGHNAYRSFDLPWVGETRLSLSQSVGVGFDSVGGVGTSLSHNANVSRNSREGKNWDMFMASANDTRLIGETGSFYQLVNLQYTRGYDASRVSSFSGSFNLQLANQQFGDEPASGWQESMSLDLAYRQRNLFGLTGLNWTSDLAINPPRFLQYDRYGLYGSDTSYYGGSSTSQGFGTQRWTNRLDYVIGKMRLSLVGRLTHDSQGLGETLLFQLSRAIN